MKVKHKKIYLKPDDIPGFHKNVYLVYTKELRPFVEFIKNKLNFRYGHHKSCAAYIAVETYGVIINNASEKTKIKVPKCIDHYLYSLYLFRSKEELIEFKANAGIYGKNMIKKWERALNVPEEPYEKKVERPGDMKFLANVTPNTVYGPNRWIEIDKNSAEPYYVSKFIPYLQADIEKLYNERKEIPENKFRLNAINGNLRNSHASIYLKVVNSLYDEMMNIAQTLLDKGAIPFAIRRDAIIAAVPNDFKIPESIKIGSKIGEFKMKEDYGCITTNTSSISYETNMNLITTKNTGKINESLLDEVTIILDEHLQIGLLIGGK